MYSIVSALSFPMASVALGGAILYALVASAGFVVLERGLDAPSDSTARRAFRIGYPACAVVAVACLLAAGRHSRRLFETTAAFGDQSGSVFLFEVAVYGVLAAVVVQIGLSTWFALASIRDERTRSERSA